MTNKKSKTYKKKLVISKILTVLNLLTPLIDLCFLYDFYEIFQDQEDYTWLSYVALAGIVYLLYRWGKALFMVWKSKTDALEYLLNNRVIPICGKQRVGKSSLASYFSKIMPKSVYSNVPIKIKGKFTKKLTTDILTCKERIPDGSLLFVDEASLFYYNNKTENGDDNIFGQAVLCQCVGHFFDGNILYVSVDTDRLPKPIRDNYSSLLQVTASGSYKYSILGDALLEFFAKPLLKEKRIFTGVRVWKAQHYERIMQEQYISLLGKEENENKFAPFMKFASFQTFGLDTYDDRYMQAYYLEKPEHKDERWKSLQLTYADFKDLYDGAVIKYLVSLNETQGGKNIKIINVEKTE